MPEPVLAWRCGQLCRRAAGPLRGPRAWHMTMQLVVIIMRGGRGVKGFGIDYMAIYVNKHPCRLAYGMHLVMHEGRGQGARSSVRSDAAGEFRNSGLASARICCSPLASREPARQRHRGHSRDRRSCPSGRPQPGRGAATHGQLPGRHPSTGEAPVHRVYARPRPVHPPIRTAGRYPARSSHRQRWSPRS